MLPAIARHAIIAYTRPGELVLDPMCGIGTSLVEAAHLGRDATGVEIEQRWCELAQANIGLATAQGATGRANVLCGDATRIEQVVPARLRIAMVGELAR
jgi:DNA modification methylase